MSMAYVRCVLPFQLILILILLITTLSSSTAAQAHKNQGDVNEIQTQSQSRRQQHSEITRTKMQEHEQYQEQYQEQEQVQEQEQEQIQVKEKEEEFDIRYNLEHPTKNGRPITFSAAELFSLSHAVALDTDNSNNYKSKLYAKSSVIPKHLRRPKPRKMTSLGNNKGATTSTHSRKLLATSSAAANALIISHKAVPFVYATVVAIFDWTTCGGVLTDCPDYNYVLTKAISVVNTDNIYQQWMRLSLDIGSAGNSSDTMGNPSRAYNITMAKLKYYTSRNTTICIIGDFALATTAAIRRAAYDFGLSTGLYIPVITPNVRSTSLSLSLFNATATNIVLPVSASGVQLAPQWFRLCPTDSYQVAAFVELAYMSSSSPFVVYSDDSTTDRYGDGQYAAYLSQGQVKGVRGTGSKLAPDNATTNVPVRLLQTDSVDAMTAKLNVLANTVTNMINSTVTPIYIYAFVSKACAWNFIQALMQMPLLLNNGVFSRKASYTSPWKVQWIFSDSMAGVIADIMDTTLTDNTIGGVVTQGLTDVQRNTIRNQFDNILGFTNYFGPHKRDRNMVTLWAAYPQGQGRRIKIYIYYVYDSVISFTRAVYQSLIEGRYPLVYDSLRNELVSSSFLGSQGAVSFSATGDRINARTALIQISQSYGNGAPAYSRSYVAYHHLNHGLLFRPSAPIQSYANGGAAIASFFPPASSMPVYFPGYYQWSPVPWFGTPPSARFAGCSMTTKSRDILYVVSGSPKPAAPPLADMWQYSYAKTLWTRSLLSNIPLRPFFYGACSTDTNDDIYTFAGANSQGIGSLMQIINTYTNDVQDKLYTRDPDTQSTAALEAVKFTAVSDPLSNSIFVAAGQHQAPLDVVTFWLYSTTTNVFSFQFLYSTEYALVSPFNQTAVNGTVVLSYANFANVYATMTANPVVAVTLNKATHYVLFSGVLGQVAYAYNWAKNAMFPIFLSGVSCPQVTSVLRVTALSNVAYVIYGQPTGSPSSGPSSVSNSVFSVDFNCPGVTCGVVTVLGSFSTPRRGINPFLLGSDLLVFGGLGYDAPSQSTQLLNDLVSYSTSGSGGDTITTSFTSPSPRKWHSMTKIGGCLLVFGGLAETTPGLPLASVNELWAYNINQAYWVPVLTTGTPPSFRYGHNAIRLHVGVYIFGGQDEFGVFYGDLYAWNNLTSSWTQINYLANSAQPTVGFPVPRAFANANPYKDTGFALFGGIDGSGTLLTDMWYFSVATLMWRRVLASPGNAASPPLYFDLALNSNLAPPFGGPPAVYARSSALFGSVFYVFGGADASAKPTSETWFTDLDNDLVRGVGCNWTKGANIAFQGTSAGFGGSAYASGLNFVALFGGYSSLYTNSVFMMYFPNGNNWTTVASTASTRAPAARTGAAMVVFGNRVFVFGGALASPSATLQAQNYLTNELWSVVLGPPCSDRSEQPQFWYSTLGASGSLTPPPCTNCSAGTYRVGAQCVPCPVGTYGLDGQVCLPCPLGFHNSVEGTALASGCVPCDVNTYAPTIGTGTCLSCATNYFCPVGSSKVGVYVPPGTQLLTTAFTQSQPTPLASQAQLVTDVTTALGIVSGVVILVMGVAYILLLMCGKQMLLSNLDFMMKMAHGSDLELPVVKMQTACGGVCSVSSFFVLFYIAAGVFLPYFINNHTEIRSLINSSLSNTTVVSDEIRFDVQLNTYRGYCIQPPANLGLAVWPPTDPKTIASLYASSPSITGPCNSSVTISQLGAQLLLTQPTSSLTTFCTYSLPADTSSTALCQATLVCTSCTLPAVAPSILFVFGEPNTFATDLSVNLTTTSSYVNQNSSLYGDIQPTQGYVFRGADPPSNIYVTLTPSVYTDKTADTKHTGYFVYYQTASQGSMIQSSQFYDYDSVHVQFVLTTDQSTLLVVLSALQTPVQFLAALISSLSGSIGALAVIVLLFEVMLEEPLLNWLSGRGRARGGEGGAEGERSGLSGRAGWSMTVSEQRRHYVTQLFGRMPDKTIDPQDPDQAKANVAARAKAKEKRKNTNAPQKQIKPTKRADSDSDDD